MLGGLVSGIVGDSLGSMASKFMGSASNFRSLAQFNNLSPFDVVGKGIQIGQQIGIPGFDRFAGVANTVLGAVKGGNINPQTLLNLGLDIAPELLGQINGTESALEILGMVRNYSNNGDATGLVQWLLDRGLQQRPR